MARRRRLAEMQEDNCELEMTPMIDVTFLLLIFFMCTLKFKTLEGKLAAYLPKDVGVNTMESVPLEKVEVRLDVENPGTKLKPDGKPYTGQGRFIFDSSRSIRYSVGPKRTFDLDVVRRTLEEIKVKQPDRPATVDARTGIVYGDVVPVLDVALGAGYREITFVGAYPEKAAQ